MTDPEKDGVSKTTEEDFTSSPIKCYLKAFPLRKLEDLDVIKNEIESGNILIIRITHLAEKSVDEVKRAVEDLREFVRLVRGDIARLGEERIVITPSWVKIWRSRVESESG